MSQIIDLTLTMDNDIITCGTPWHPQVSLEPMGTINTVGRNTTKITMGSHTATHMDAPLHFLDGTYGIDRIDLSHCCGEISIFNFTHISKGQLLHRKDFGDKPMKKRVLLRFDWYTNWGDSAYYDGYPYLSEEAAHYLIDSGVVFLAMDTPSPDNSTSINKTDDSPIHKILLKKGIVLVEYLTNTAELEESATYDIVALPLKLRGCDASPARVIAIKK